MSEIEQMIEQEKRLLEYQGDDSVIHFTDYLKLKADEGDRITRFMSGFKAFDEKFQGLATGEVTVVTGWSGEGKTLFAESLVRRLVLNDSGVKGCMFSFEVTPTMLLLKYSTEQTLPLYLPKRLEALNVEWLIARMHEAKLKYGCNVFIIDHLHYMVDMQLKQNMSLNIGAFMRRLKLAALSLNVHPILIAHQDKPDKGQDVPKMESIRDSSFISQEADNVIVVWRRKDYETMEIAKMDANTAEKIRQRQPGFFDPANPNGHGFAIVQIAKARRSGTFRWPKVFQKSGNWLEEV